MLYLHRLIRAITYTEKQKRADDSFWGHSKGEQNSWVFYLPAIRASCQSILDRSVFPGWEMFRECVLSQATHWVNCHCIVFMSLVCIFHKLSQHHIAMWKTLQLQCRTCKKKKRRKLCKSVQRVLTLPLSLAPCSWLNLICCLTNKSQLTDHSDLLLACASCPPSLSNNNNWIYNHLFLSVFEWLTNRT